MARVARRFLDEILDGWGDPALVDALSLPVTELVTNAQIHARTDVELVLQETTDVIRVEVHDFSPDLPVIRSRERTAGTGRGLALVAALVERWGITPTATGKCAWIDVRRGPSSERPAAP
jgi:two-component sensor histidine kinase